MEVLTRRTVVRCLGQAIRQRPAAPHGPAALEALGLRARGLTSGGVAHTAAGHGDFLPPPPSSPPPGQGTTTPQPRHSFGSREQVDDWNVRLKVAVAKGASPAQAAQWLQDMRGAGVEPNVQSYNLMLTACGRHGEPSAAEATMKEMSGLSIAPNVASYTSLSVAYKNAKDFEAVYQILQRMRAAGVEPNDVTYTTLVDAASREGDAERASALIEEMEESGVELQTGPYTALLNHHAKASNTKEFGALWQKMIAKGVTPDDRTYGALIVLRVVQGDVQKAEEHFNEMVQAGIKPSVSTYVLLVNAFARDANVEKASEYWARIREMNQRPPIQAFASMVQVHAKAGDVDKAEDFLMQMLQRYPAGKSQLNSRWFAMLMDAHARTGDFERCEALLETMQKHGIAPNRVTYNTAMKARVNAGDLAGAEHWFKAMENSGNLKPDVYSHYTLFFGLVKSGHAEHLERAEALLEKMKERKIEIVDNHYLSLSQGWSREGDPERSERWEAAAEGVEPAGGRAGPSRPAARAADQDDDEERADLAARVKQLQRDNEEEKQQWKAYCDKEGSNRRDPNRHTADFLRRFFDVRRDGTPAATPAAPANLEPPQAAALLGVDWIEETVNGEKQYRSTKPGAEVSAEAPHQGIVQLHSPEHGPYYWDVAANTTSWDPPAAS